ncbi:hypothetical protein CRG98_045982 [Punica granatum]|uniref:ATP-dependent DNA helicase n=1 Tax=Punica granatum TaxID=22663 RepID=A0A2I0HQS3_PUNGR|nr:hypothetical protein CRG98_045982 [Punica granatum]
MVGRILPAVVSGCRNYSSRSSGHGRNWAKNANLQKAAFEESPPRRAPRTRIKWTEEQARVISAISSGRSVFVTGSAGTGKTALVKHAIKLLQKSLGRSKVFVTASTGIAAYALGGQTLHSFAGIGPPVNDRELLLERVLSDRRAIRRWKRALALFIDEISMIDGELFDHLEFIAREVRESGKSWGGIQLVVCGDFFQLPPVNKRGYLRLNKEFAFEADCWDSSFGLQVELTKVFRQSEERLIKLLQGIRKGQIDPEDMLFLEKSCSLNDKLDASVVRLYPRNEDVNYVNEERMSELGKERYLFVAEDSGIEQAMRQLRFGLAPDEIFLCEGARVMFVKNVDTSCGLINGATGTIIRFMEDKAGVSSNVCQGGGVLPVVKFDSGQIIVVEPETWCLMEANTVVARRRQIPLILAWALSIHKCQGMTLDRAHMDLSRAFGYGMVYVALSRVRNLTGLYLSGLNPSKIKARPKVLKFYERITNQQDTE